MEPYPIGTQVHYHGSLEHMHREYRITGTQKPTDGQPDLAVYSDEQIAEWYPDGVAYSMWPLGVPEKFGDRDKSLHYVRRDSITPIETEDLNEGFKKDYR